MGAPKTPTTGFGKPSLTRTLDCENCRLRNRRLRKTLVELGVLRQDLLGGLLVLAIEALELVVDADLRDLLQGHAVLIGESLQAAGGLVGELDREGFHGAG